VFGSTASIPSAGLLSSYHDGYVGILTPSSTLQADFIDRFWKEHTFGTIGFDSDVDGSTNTYSAAIDLTGFSPEARLGSMTSAILAGTITPQGSTYQFGGGGGVLTVSSALTDGTGSVSRSLSVQSAAAAPLTVWLTSTGNTYTGGTTVTNSAVIFAGGALPSTGTLYATQGGYIGTSGTEENGGITAASFISRFDPSMTGGIIGADTATGSSTLVIDDATIDLSHFTSTADPAIYLGSSTSAIISTLTSIILPASATAYRFTGYKAGRLTVNSALTGTYGVIIGDPDVPATFNDPTGANSDDLSTVILGGANTYSGGTSFYGGRLILGDRNTLVTGTLSVLPTNYTLASGLHPKLETGTSGLTITNPVSLATILELGGSFDFGLSGIISGLGGLIKSDANTITLSGANSFSGGLTVSSGLAVLTADTSAGSGTLTINGGTAAFLSSNPVVNGLSGGAGTLSLTDSATLTVNQNIHDEFDGAITGTGSSLVVTGNGTLILSGSNTYTGGTTADGATLIFGSVSALGATSTLSLTNDGYIGIADASIGASLQSSFIDRLCSSSQGTIGLDSTYDTNSVNSYSGDVDLSNLSGVRLGSATSAILTGTITPYGTTYLFGGGGGMLEIASNLTDYTGDGTVTRSVSLVSPQGEALTLILAGANTYSGGTTIMGSVLRIANASALPNSGTITLAGKVAYLGFDYTPDTSSISSLLARIQNSSDRGVLGFDEGQTVTLSTATVSEVMSAGLSLGTSTTATLSITTDTQSSELGTLALASVKSGNLSVTSLPSGSYNLLIGLPGDDQNITNTLAAICGTESTVTLFGANTAFSGSVTMKGGRLVLGDSQALGTGDFTLQGVGSLSTTAAGFTISNSMYVGGMSELTIDANDDMTLSGAIAGGGSIIKEGSATLVLSGDNTYSGGTTISAGLLSVASSTGLGYGTVSLNGGSLSVGSGVSLSNTLSLTNGIIGGTGAYTDTLSAVTIGEGVTVSPGDLATSGSTGALTFGNGLVLASGGTYQLDFSDVTGTAGTGWDKIIVTGILSITATSSDQFTISISSGDATNFDQTQYYQWLIASTSGGITGFDAAAFAIDVTGLSDYVGTFSVSSSDGNLYLNFTPVPEPSTYALMGLGLAGLLVARMRRRRS